MFAEKHHLVYFLAYVVLGSSLTSNCPVPTYIAKRLINICIRYSPFPKPSQIPPWLPYLDAVSDNI